MAKKIETFTPFSFLYLRSSKISPFTRISCWPFTWTRARIAYLKKLFSYVFTRTCCTKKSLNYPYTKKQWMHFKKLKFLTYTHVYYSTCSSSPRLFWKDAGEWDLFGSERRFFAPPSNSGQSSERRARGLRRASLSLSESHLAQLQLFAPPTKFPPRAILKLLPGRIFRGKSSEEVYVLPLFCVMNQCPIKKTFAPHSLCFVASKKAPSPAPGWLVLTYFQHMRAHKLIIS